MQRNASVFRSRKRREIKGRARVGRGGEGLSPNENPDYGLDPKLK